MSKVLKTKPLTSWDDLQKAYVKNNKRWEGWLFRGQCYGKESNSQPSLKTSLERAMDRFGVPLKKAPELEYQILRDFKRRCNLAAPYTPPGDNVMEWLALLRHYGGPARLQDWTYSFWNAVYFALDRARNDKDTCEVWALNAREWQKRIETKYKKLKKVQKRYGSNSVQESKAIFRMNNKPGLWFMNAFRLNDRLSAQQGAFVLPLDVTKSLMANLYNNVVPKTIRDQNLMIYEIRSSKELLRECFKELHRMNISHATLYPGLEGLALNMENVIAMPHLFHNVRGNLGSGPF